MSTRDETPSLPDPSLSEAHIRRVVADGWMTTPDQTGLILRLLDAERAKVAALTAKERVEGVSLG